MLKFTSLRPWNGSPIDMTQYGTVIIWCTVAPTSAQTLYAVINDGTTTDKIPQSSQVDSGTGLSVTPTISAIGRYFAVGNAYFQLSTTTDSNKGTFYIQGIQ